MASELLRALEPELRVPGYTVAFAGAGGKTTSIYALAEQLRDSGKRVLIATTTHMQLPVKSGAVDQSVERSLRQLEQGLAVIGRTGPEGKMGPPSPEVWSACRQRADVVLVEADGSRRMPVKYPRPDEPVSPERVDRWVAVAGLSALGLPPEASCHRWTLALERMRREQREIPAIVDEALIAWLLSRGYGHLRPLYVLNQADTPERLRSAERIGDWLQSDWCATAYPRVRRIE